ncbi:MAG: PHP-associated domain-containing protein [archaeon]|nr:PHP-associated domain-containing protein [archaeon]
MKLDLHMHSEQSCDSFMKPDKMIKVAKSLGLDGIAITDHNTLPKIKAQEGDDFLVIPGEEILTRRGEIIGLNLTEKIPKLLSVGETVDRIYEQGGTLLIPHPFDITGKCLMCNYKKLKRSFLFEAFNGGVILNYFNVLAKNYAKKHDFAVAGSSDAHDYKYIGYGYTELKKYETSIDGALKSLLKGRGFAVGGKVAPNGAALDIYVNVFTEPIARFMTWYKKKK